jgi:hypothetical protein
MRTPVTVLIAVALSTLVGGWGGPALAADPAFVTDDFKCYDVKESERANAVTTLEDQFELETATARRAVFLCNPVDKNGEGIDNPLEHLVCYYTTRVGPVEERVPRPRQVIVDNQFGRQTLTIAGRANLLCVPSVKTVVGARCGDGLSCPGGQVCDREDATCSPDPPGVCAVTPTICLGIFDPVCGCNSVTYPNDCERLKAGVTLAHRGPCP